MPASTSRPVNARLILATLVLALLGLLPGLAGAQFTQATTQFSSRANTPQFLTEMDRCLYFVAEWRKTTPDPYLKQVICYNRTTNQTTAITDFTYNNSDEMSIGPLFAAQITIGQTTYKKLLFAGRDKNNRGMVLWVYNPDPVSGQPFVKEVKSGLNSVLGACNWIKFNNLIYFRANDGLYTYNAASDTATQINPASVNCPTIVGGNLDFRRGLTSSADLAMLSGSVLNQVGAQFALDPQSVIGYNGNLYYGARSASHGVQLFKDETELTNYNTSGDGLITRGLYAIGSRIIIRNQTYRYYYYDFTNPGSPTQGFYAITPGAAGSSPGDGIVYKNKLYFSADNGTGVQKLFALGATDTAPAPVGDLSTPGDFYVDDQGDADSANDLLYFSAADASGQEAWRYDGSSLTRMGDIVAGAGSSNPKHFTMAGRSLFVTAKNGGAGRDVWYQFLAQTDLITPALGGVTATTQTINDNQTVNPFANVTITDGDSPLLTVKVRLDDPTKGVFTPASLAASGFSLRDAGRYILAGQSPAQCQAALRALVFRPTENKLPPVAPPNGTPLPTNFETTTFTILVDDGISPVYNDNQTQVKSISVNDAPAVAGTPALAAVLEDTVNPPGATIASLLPYPTPTPLPAVYFSDPDLASSRPGIAVVGNTANASTQGVWQYMVAGGTWVAVGTVDDAGSALALDSATKLRFLPAADFCGNAPVLVFRALDNLFAGTFTSVATRRTTSTANHGNPYPISNLTYNLAAPITPVNDAPQLIADAALAAVNEDPATNPGATVASLFPAGTVVTDVDPGASLGGIAVVGNTANAATQGKWQYTTDGSNWFDVGTVGDGASALALSAATLVRFQPEADYNGTPDALAVRALDDSYGGGFTGGSTRMTVNTAANGGTTAISAVSRSLTTSITPVPDAPRITGTAGGQAVNDNATLPPFGSVTFVNIDNAATILTLTITLDNAAKGSFTPASMTAAGFGTIDPATISRTGTAAQLQAAVRLLVFAPAAHRVAPGLTETTTINLDLSSNPSLRTVDGGTTVVSTSLNAAPAIGGAVADQTVTDQSTLHPFANLTLTDDDIPPQALLVTAALDPAKGAFTLASLGGFTDQTGGVYAFSGTAAAAQAALRGLVFKPAENRVAPGQTETSVLTVTANDGVGGLASNNTTTVIATSVNDAPVIGGTAAAQAVNDNATIPPFTGVTLADPDSPAQTLTVTVTLDDAARGAFSAASLLASGFSAQGGGAYRFTGTAAASQAALRQLVFVPAANRVAPGQSETSALRITANDGVAPDVIDNTTTLISTSVNDAPVIGGTAAGQAVNDNATIQPFSAVTVTHADLPAQALSIALFLDNTAKGTLGALGSFVPQGDGSYLFSGTAAAAQAALRALIFTPTPNRVAPGQTETTSFTLVVSDGVAAPVSNATTTVAAASINDAPVIGATFANQAVQDNQAIQPFTSVTLVDADRPAQTLTVGVTLDDNAKGAFTPASLSAAGFTFSGGVYTFTGAAPAAQAALRQLAFAPVANRVAPGQSETTTLTLTANDGIAAAVTDRATSVLATSVNDPPAISGTAAGQTMNDNETKAPFTGVAIIDPDNPPQTLSVAVSLDNPAKGAFTPASLTASGFVAQDVIYVFIGTAAQVTAAIRQLVFAPAANRLAPGLSETAQFTILTSDRASSTQTNHQTTVQVTSVNDPPTSILLSAAAVAENKPAGTKVADLSGSDPDTGDSATLAFSLVGGAGATDNGSFDVVGTELRTRAPFDYETRNSYSIRLRATDTGGKTFENSFTITVTDANDAPTAIGLNPASVAENQPAGTVVGTLSDTDQDTADSPAYALVAGTGAADNASFTISGNQLKTASAFDYETKNQYSVRVQASDGHGGLYEQALTIAITDANDAPTAIALSPAGVAENQPAGTVVGTLSDTDQDTADSPAYALVAGTGAADNASFTISGNQLKTALAFDFETKKLYSVRIQVNDGHGGVFEKVQAISITDANDAPTAIDLSNAGVAENQPAGTVVGSLSATDQDPGDSHSYALVAGAGASDNAAFTITGNQLKTARSFDYETRNQYNIRIQVNDGHGGTFENTFVIGVTDANDPPTAIDLSNAGVAENQPAGTRVGTLSATDPDAGASQIFTLVAGAGDADNALFAIAGDELQTATNFDYETRSAYSIRVEVNDGKGGRFARSFAITVIDGNDVPQDLVLSNAAVNEKKPAGTAVGDFTTLDQDGADLHTYALVAGAGDTDNARFQIQGATLKTNAEFDAAAQGPFSIRVETDDGRGGKLARQFSITLTRAADTAKPDFKTGPLILLVTQRSATVQWEASEPATAVVSYGPTPALGSTITRPTPALADQVTLDGLTSRTLYYVQVALTDAAGNGPTLSPPLTFTTAGAPDSTAPVIIEGPLATTINDTNAVVRWTTDEPATAKITFTDGTVSGVNESTLLENHHSFLLTGLRPATEYHVTVESADALGNGPARSAPFSVRTLATPDVSRPVIIEGPLVVSLTDSSAAIAWKTDEPATSIVELKTSTTTALRQFSSAQLTQHHQVMLGGLAPATRYSFRVQSFDAGGNGPAVSDYGAFTTDATVDVTPPRILEGPTVIGLADHTATIYWRTDEPSDSRVRYGTDGRLNLSQFDPARVTEHQLTLVNLAPGTTYRFAVTSNDASGNTVSTDGGSGKVAAPSLMAVSASGSQFMTQAQPDTTAPVFTDGPRVASVSDTSAVITWTSNEIGDARLDYGTTTMTQFMGEIERSFTHVMILTGLNPGTQYQFRVSTQDVSGNLAVAPAGSLTTAANPDLTPPSFTVQPSVSGITVNSAVVKWQTGELATSQVEFGTAPDNLSRIAALSGLRSAHQLNLNNLADGTTYYYATSSTDASGNTRRSAVGSFTTPWIIQPADLLLQMNAQPTTATAGTHLTLRLSATNAGSTATPDAVLTVTLPARVRVEAVLGLSPTSVTLTGGGCVLRLGTLAGLQTSTATLGMVVDETLATLNGPLTFSARISDAGYNWSDTNKANNSAAAAVSFVTATGALAIEPAPASGGWLLTGPGVSLQGRGARTLDASLIGQYTITWQPLEGWFTPSPATQALTLDGQLTFAGNYQPNAPACLTLALPDGFQYRVGDPLRVEWTSNLNVTGTVVNFELWRDGQRAASLGAAWSSTGTGQYTGLVPGLAPGPYTLRMVSAWNPLFWIASPQPLTISGQVMAVSIPAATRAYAPGDPLAVTWTNAILLAGTSVRLELWDARGFVASLGSDWSASGKHTLQVRIPKVPGGSHYRIRSFSVWDSALWAQTDTELNIQIPNAAKPGAWTPYE